MAPWSGPGKPSVYHRTMPAPARDPDRAPPRRRLRASRWQPARRAAGIVMAFAVVHPDGVVVFDTGIGVGDAEIEAAYRPTVRALPELLRGRRNRARATSWPPRTRTSISTTAARTARCPASRSTSRRPSGPRRTNPTTRSRAGSTRRAPRYVRHDGDAELLSGHPADPDARATRPATSRSSSTRRTAGRSSSARRSTPGPSGSGRGSRVSPVRPAPGIRPRTGRRWPGCGRSRRTGSCSATTDE